MTKKLTRKSKVFWPMLSTWEAMVLLPWVSVRAHFLLHCRRIAHVHPVQQIERPLRQRSHDLPEILGEVDVAGLQAGIDAGGFLHQRER